MFGHNLIKVFLSLDGLDPHLLPQILVTLLHPEMKLGYSLYLLVLFWDLLKDLYRWDFHHYLTLLISQESKQKPRGRFGLLTLDMLERAFYGTNIAEIDSITAALKRKIYLGSHTKHIVNITNLSLATKHILSEVMTQLRQLEKAEMSLDIKILL